MDNLKILFVEDNLDHQELVAWSLKEHFTNIDLVIAESGNECLMYCKKVMFDLILLDYKLPDTDGISILDSLIKAGHEIPIIIITGMGNENIAVECLKLGAYDYITKTGNYYETLPVVVQGNIEKYHIKREREKLQKLLEEKNKLLERVSVTEGLTGLYNHKYFFDRLKFELNRSQRYGFPLSCLLIDLDFFKNINDYWGHLIGDFVLKETAQNIKEDLRDIDIIARYGGDEFSIIMPNTSSDHALIIAERIRKNIEGRVITGKNGIVINVTVTIGIASFPLDTGSSIPEKLVEYADIALYKAKIKGRNKISMYTDVTDNKVYGEIEEFDEFKRKIQSFSSAIKKKAYESIRSFLSDIEKIDPYLFHHSEKVRKYSIMLAKEIGLYGHDIEIIECASLLHDIGKIGIRQEIINKTGRLTGEEYREMKRHPVITMEIIKDAMLFDKEIPLVLYHHENYDGSGYPTGIKGKKIPVGARIISIADAYAAMISDRKYQKALKKEEAKMELKRYSNLRYDPVYTNIFLKI
ncbi:MAG: diguanylate cyclase [Nitrospirota bacterium]